MQDDRPIRVCYVLSHFHPRASGAERQALAQGIELVRRGHEVRVVTRAIPGEPRDDEIGGVKIHRRVDPISRGPLFGLTFVLGVVRALRRLRPEYDLIHTHQGLWEAISTGAGRSFLKGAPILIQPASSGYFGEASELSRTRGFPWLRRLILRNPAFAAISADIERQWRDLGVPAGKMIRMVSGVDSEHFRPGPSRLDSELPPRPRAVFTGRLHPQKNLDVLLDVWPLVHEQTGGSLILVGDGPERARLEALSNERGLSRVIRFTGSVSDPSDHLRAADVFVLPSVAEGMSNSLLEAMSTALPCLVSDIGGNDDLVVPHETGLLLPPDDRSAWAAALISIFQDPSSRSRMGDRSRGVIERDYSLERVVDRYVSLYRRLLAGRGVKDEDRE